MTDQPLYSPTQAAKAANISIQSLRNYGKRYYRYLSPHAAPKTGETRWFTLQDIRLLAYIAHKTTKQNLSHDQLIAQLDKDVGELEQFSEYSAPGDEQVESTELMPPGLLRAYEVLLNDSKLREQRTQENVETLQQENARLRQELGRVEGALESYRILKRRPRWLVWLFGGE